MRHLDLFSGIGGFAYAIDQVWENVEHVFCDNDKFCQKVLSKHWPDSIIYEDIRSITNTSSDGFRQRTAVTNEKGHAEESHQSRELEGGSERSYSLQCDILTGGFPCQPFSQAGRRRGTTDDRYLWPEMLRVIQLTKPTWIIAENVRGILTIEGGLVFEQVCVDLEASGYEVQPFIIPAVSVNAPHRRDRVWFIAHTKHKQTGNQESRGDDQGTPIRITGSNSDATDTTNGRFKQCLPIGETQNNTGDGSQRNKWEQDWIEVAATFCRMDDVVPNRVDRLKSLGNAIVPEVALQILRSIKEVAI